MLTYADFTSTKYADVEDMFDVRFYPDLVNEEYEGSLAEPVKETDLTSKHRRIVRRLEEYFQKKPMKVGPSFSHYRPARLFAENASTLRPNMSEDTLDRFDNAFKKLNALLAGVKG